MRLARREWASGRTPIVGNPTAKAGAFSGGPPLTPKSKGRLETTLTGKFKTDVRMPPQFGPLEGPAVDYPGGGDETGLSLKRCSATLAMEQERKLPRRMDGDS